MGQEILKSLVERLFYINKGIDPVERFGGILDKIETAVRIGIYHERTDCFCRSQ